MLIKELNVMFRKHHRWIFGIFSAIIVVSFVGFLTPGRFGWGDGGPESQVVGTAFGDKVTFGDLQEIAGAFSILSGSGRREADIPQLFAVYCQKKKAEQIGLAVSDKEVADALRQMPYCQTDGKFDNKKLTAILRSMGVRDKDFFEALRLELLLDKLRRQISGGIVVTDAEARNLYRVGNMKYDGIVVAYSGKDFIKQVPAATAEQLKKYFDANRDRYLITGKVQGLVAKLDYAAYRAIAEKQVNDKKLEAFFNKNSRLFADAQGKVPEFAKVRKDVAKRFVDVTARLEASQAMNRFAQVAYEELSEVKVAAEREKKFSDLAKKHNIAICAKGEAALDAPQFGSVKSPELMKELREAGDGSCITRVVAGEQQAFLGCVTKRVETRRALLKEVEAKVKSDYADSAARDLAVAAAGKFSRQLKTAVAGKRAAIAAAVKDAKVKKISFGAMDGKLPEGFEIGASAMTMVSPLEATGEMATADGAQVALLLKRIAPDMTGYDKVAEQYKMMCRYQKAQLSYQQFFESIASECRMVESLRNRGVSNE